MILVAGASGTLGKELVARLVAAGHPVTAASRHPELLSVPDGVTTRRLDVRVPDSIPAALDGAHTVISAIHGLAPPTRDNHPGVVDGPGVRRLIGTASEMGVQRFVFVSALGASPSHPARFFQMKHHTEDLLLSTEMSWVIVRPAAFMEVHALLLMGEPLRAGKAVPLIGPGTTPIDWVSTRDTAEVIGALVEQNEREVVEVLGPRPMTRLEALGILEEATGETARRRHLPLPLARTMARVSRLIHPGVGYLLETAVAEGGRFDEDAVPPTRTVTGQTTLETVAADWAA